MGFLLLLSVRNAGSSAAFASDFFCSEEAGFGSSDAAAEVSAGAACDVDDDPPSPCVGLDGCSLSSLMMLPHWMKPEELTVHQP